MYVDCTPVTMMTSLLWSVQPEQPGMTTVPHCTEVPSFRPSRADINRNLFLSLASSSVQNNKQTVRSAWGSGETSSSTVATHLFCDLGIMTALLYATSSSSVFQGWTRVVISEGPMCSLPQS